VEERRGNFLLKTIVLSREALGEDALSDPSLGVRDRSGVRSDPAAASLGNVDGTPSASGEKRICKKADDTTAKFD
jgi:hypothetical protein